MTIWPNGAQVVTVFIQGYDGALGDWLLNYRYVIPSASETPSTSETPTMTVTSSATASASVSEGSSPTPSITSSNTASSSVTPTSSGTGTPSNSPVCNYEPAAVTSGAIGSLPPRYPATALPWTGGCPGYYGMPGGIKSLYMVDLSDYPIGGTLVITTCNSWNGYSFGTSFSGDTVLNVGTGCPGSAASFRCVGGVDDSCGVLSLITIYGTTTDKYWAIVSGYAGGTITNAGLNWYYTSPSGSVTGTLSPGALPSNSSTATSSLTSSQTPSRTPSATRTPTASVSKGFTALPTASPSASSTSCRQNLQYYGVFMQQLNGGSGLVSSASMTTSTSNFPYEPYWYSCGSMSVNYGYRKHFYLLSLAGLPTGGNLSVDTCAGETLVFNSISFW